ncbi:ABC transporter ATP-binding protein [Paenibacillus sp. J5C_2022]|uniref:ABC transporter ATP-binding protein n=1 Tax=Paenibacillus sp. J5C2022 TaxID=2977129 RepID=UPI0021D09CEC|nr:ABC transporter ATP-binding protein [Paenibacillus sp. J5C2022]MCU6709568.1 ABC transporter ATP-binding protein [Paenibacillus sp. J5C2022]
MKQTIGSDAKVVLEMKNVTKRIGNKTLVSGLSFEMKKGEIVGLLGPNGAGKTTTIRMMVGLIGMTDGDILIGGNSIRTNFEGAIKQVGGIIENPEFYPYMSGMDNLKQYQRMSPGVREARIREVTELVGLQHALDKKVKAYSLGMRQRLGIAQALLHKPSVLILDEPTNGLDPAGIREMRDYMKKIAEEEGISVLVSSHLLSEMELMCSRVVVIQNGKLVTVRSIGSGSLPEGEASSISLQVNELDAAVVALTSVKSIKQVQNFTADNRILISVMHEEIPAVVKALTDAGVGIYRIEESKSSLEDEFMKWTGGNHIA